MKLYILWRGNTIAKLACTAATMMRTTVSPIMTIDRAAGMTAPDCAKTKVKEANEKGTR